MGFSKAEPIRGGRASSSAGRERRPALYTSSLRLRISSLNCHPSHVSNLELVTGGLAFAHFQGVQRDALAEQSCPEVELVLPSPGIRDLDRLEIDVFSGMPRLTQL
jgi:hypothetical protein